MDRYDGVSFMNFPKEEGLDSYDAFDVLEDKKGNIWVGSLNGVYRYDGNTLTYFNDNKARD